MDEVKKSDMEVSLFLATDLQTTSEVRVSYRLFEEYFYCARAIYPHKSVITAEEVSFARHCRKIIDQGETAVQRKLLPLRPLLGMDMQQELISTLEVYLLDADANSVLTGKLLFLHKNTINYRLGKIHERLNYSVLKMPEANGLYTAVALQRLLRESK